MSREKIAECIAQGYTQQETAEIVGIAASTVAEYQKDEKFKELVIQLSAKPEFRYARVNKKYDHLEETTLNSLRAIAKNELTDVSDLCKILDAVGRNKSKGVLPLSGVLNPTVGLALIFPANMIPSMEVNDKNQVTKIGDRSMLPMSMVKVEEMFKEMNENESAIQGSSKRVDEEHDRKEGESNEQRAAA